MAQVLDYSAGKPGALNVQRAGYSGAVRYIGFPARTKCTNAQELADFTAHGLGVALVFEDTRTNWQGGYSQGITDARLARQHATAIGFPRDRPIYMAIDQQVTGQAAHNTAVGYIAGAASILGSELTGVYGQHSVCVAVSGQRVAKYYWQCRAWSGTPVKYFDARHLYQFVGTVHIGGIDCDFNDVLAADWGQHNFQGVDDVSWNDELSFSDPATGEMISYPAKDWLMWTNYYSNQIPKIVEMMSGALAAATRNPNLTAETIKGIFDQSIQDHPIPVQVDQLSIEGAVTSAVENMSDEALARLARASADEQDRRQRERLAE